MIIWFGRNEAFTTKIRQIASCGLFCGPLQCYTLALICSENFFCTRSSVEELVENGKIWLVMTILVICIYSSWCWTISD